jgi:hypothetical protein
MSRVCYDLCLLFSVFVCLRDIDKEGYRETETERDKERDRDRERDRETERDRQRQRERTGEMKFSLE